MENPMKDLVKRTEDIRTKKAKKHWACVDCEKDTWQEPGDYYMIKFELWQKFGVGKEMLCRGCMEKRLGHKFTKKDMLNAPINYPEFFSWNID